MKIPISDYDIEYQFVENLCNIHVFLGTKLVYGGSVSVRYKIAAFSFQAQTKHYTVLIANADVLTFFFTDGEKVFGSNEQATGLEKIFQGINSKKTILATTAYETIGAMVVYQLCLTFFEYISHSDLNIINYLAGSYWKSLIFGALYGLAMLISKLNKIDFLRAQLKNPRFVE